jgi:hypothetical protein
MVEKREESEAENRKRDLWGKVESFAKIVAAVGVSIGSVAIPYIIGKTSEQSRRAQVYMQVMSEREKADTAIRQEMFKTLLADYLGRFEDKNPAIENEESFRKRIMFLDLLTLNFQEYLNARPLFEDVYFRLEKAKTKEKKGGKEYETWGKLQQDLFRVAKNVASSQSAMLTQSGLSRTFDLAKGKAACIRLYSVENLVELTDKFEKQPLLDRKTESCSDASVQNSRRMDKGSPAIDIELEEVNEVGVRVKVTPYQESFKDGTLNFVQSLKPLKFEVSFFDLPYMDNTRLFDGSRFALLLSHADKKEGTAELNAIIFKGEFMSLRDRPFFEEMLQKLNKDAQTN